MRKATFASLVFVVCGSAASAQLSLTPKAGIEQSFTSVGYNNQNRFSPMGSVVSPQFSVRFDYRFKNIHGPFVGLATNRSLVAYEFMDPETGATNFKASRGDMQLRMEAGYMYSTKPIALGKAKSTAPAAKAASPKTCGGYYMSRCGQARAAAAEAAAKKNEPMNLRIQPFAGMAFVPNPQTALSSTMTDYAPAYQYKAGNWSSAFIAGSNFEIGKGAQRKYVIAVQYLRGIGNLGNETLVTGTDTKATITQLKSSASAWNVAVGVPLSLTKKKTVVKETTVTAPAIAPAAKQPEAKKSTCPYYRSRCGNWQ